VVPEIVTSRPRRSTSSLLLTNGAWNALSAAVAGGVAFLLVPLLLHSLGTAAYGTWILIGSMFAYSSVLHFGFTGAISRQVAVALAKGTDDDLRRIMSTGTAFFTVVAIVLGTATLVVHHFIGTWFNIPAGMLDEARTAVLIVGGLLALAVVTESFGAAISGYQRYDLITICRASMIILRSVALVVVLGRGGGLLAVAWIYALSELGVNLLQYAFASRLMPPGLVRAHGFDPGLLPEMLAYGANTFLYSSGAVIAYKASEVLIGAFRQTGDVARYSVAVMGVLTLSAVIESLSAAIKPAVSDLDAREAASTIHELALATGKYSLLLILPSTAFLVLMGADFLRLWTGLTDPEVARAIAYLAVGQAFRLAQQSNFLVLAGKGEHRFFGLSVLMVGAGTVVFTLVAVGALGLGIVGAAMASSVSWMVVAGIVIPRHVNSRLGITARERRRRVFGPALAGCAPAIAVLAGWKWLHPPNSWSELFLLVAVVAAATAAGSWAFALELPERTWLRVLARRIARC
jgi:O-antigen/teichoic acid export membrane protein